MFYKFHMGNGTRNMFQRRYNIKVVTNLSDVVTLAYIIYIMNLKLGC